MKHDLSKIIVEEDKIFAINAPNRNNINIEYFSKSTNNHMVTKEDTRHKEDFLVL